MTVKKTLYISGFIVGGAIAASFIYYYLRLISIYNKVSTISEADALIQSPNVIFINLPDNDLDSSMLAALQDDTSGYNNSGSDDIDAVQFNGTIYTGDATTGIYYGIDGSTYDSNADTLTMPDGTVTNIDPSTVTFGTLESDGSFVND